jgi:hypothetical protein
MFCHYSYGFERRSIGFANAGSLNSFAGGAIDPFSETHVP